MKCILISDINGEPERGGVLARHLPEGAQVHWLSLAELAGAPELSGALLHDHLVRASGFGRAVQALLVQHETTDIAIGYSAGGTVLWQACHSGLSCGNLFCLSSTRLRNESSKPEARTFLFFDHEDPAAPNNSKLLELSDIHHRIGNEGHTAYLNPNGKMNKLAGQLLQQTIATCSPATQL